VNFANECSELLQHVSDVDINDDRRHRSWQDPALEEKIKARLEENYGACVSALRLINGSLTDILSETGTLKILTENVSYTIWQGNVLGIFILRTLYRRSRESECRHEHRNTVSFVRGNGSAG
jgi:hypothetical protein